MSPEEKIEAAQKLIDEARAEIAAKKRNWPEKIEAGMCFGEEDGDKSMWIVCDDLQLVCVSSYKAGIRWGGWRETKTRLRYLGRDLIKIADDAREPTGAELVGKVCQVSLSPINKPNGGIRCLVTSFDPIIGYRTEEGENTPWKYARLAR